MGRPRTKQINESEEEYIEEPEIPQKKVLQQQQQQQQQQQPNIKQSLNIIDVQEYMNATMEAYFKISETEMIKRTPEFYGVIVKDNEEIPTVLMVHQDGLLLPPFMIQGFMGMYPIVYDQDKQVDDHEKQVDNHSEQLDDHNTSAVEAIRTYATKEQPKQHDPETQIDNII